MTELGRVHSLPSSTREMALVAPAPSEHLGRDSSTRSEDDDVKKMDPEQPVVEIYPGDHGDRRAIVVSIGVFFALFVGFGILNIPGTFQTYWENNQLSEYSQSQVGWICAVQFFLTLFGSVFTGRWFDMHGGRVSLHHHELLIDGSCRC